MTEILAKEKQFIKLNEQLERMTMAQEAKMDSRFLGCSQKLKSLSSQSRKQGGGDGIIDAHDTISIKSTKTYIPTLNRGTIGEASCRPSSRPLNSPPPFNSTQYRPKLAKYNEYNRSQNSNRLSNVRVGNERNSTFTVKYRNPKFLESPSLEVLVKEESSSLRCLPDESRIININSAHIDDDSTTKQHSQTGNAMSSKKNVSTEGLIKFLKSKILILEEDHERISQEMAKQKELLSKALEHTKSLEQQRDQAKIKNYTLADQLSKSEKQVEEVNRLLKERLIEQNNVLKELETSKRDINLLTQTNSNLEKRLFRANEELESARNTITLMKNAERDYKGETKKESENKETQIKNLKKQRANLLNAYKKQLFLIDNLKKQNILLEQSKMLDFGEKEFAKVLDWNVHR